MKIADDHYTAYESIKRKLTLTFKLLSGTTKNFLYRILYTFEVNSNSKVIILVIFIMVHG